MHRKAGSGPIRYHLSSITRPSANKMSSHPHCPTKLTPTGHPSGPVPAGTDIAGNPASEAGTVNISCSYSLTPSLSDGESVSPVDGFRNGAVRIAVGCSKTSIPRLMSISIAFSRLEFVSALIELTRVREGCGIRNTRAKSCRSLERRCKALR